MSYFRDQLENWLRGIHIKTERTLDIGGAANPVRKRLGSLQTEEYICFDNGAEEPRTEYVKFDLNLPLKQLKGYKQEDFQFDTIFCLEVFEYIYNPIEAIKNIWRLLRDGGVAYISFPAIYPVHNPANIDYLRYTRKVIEKYMARQGFDSCEILPRVATEGRQALSEFYSKEGMHPVRHSSLPYDIGYLVKATKGYGKGV